MGHPDKITPDIIEWIVSDEKVVAKWKNFARRLNLDVYVDKIDENFSYKRKKFEKQKMKELFDVWRRASPITFTKSRLMDILGKEGCFDMYRWLQLMGTEGNTRKGEISVLLDRSLSTPRSAASLSPQPTNSANQSSSLGYHSLPPSPYSWYFESKTSDKGNMSSSDQESVVRAVPIIPVREHGILKKRPTSEMTSSSVYTTSDYHYVGRSSTDSTGTPASRESTPDSLSRPLSRLSTGENGGVSSDSGVRSKVKTLRFADDLESDKHSEKKGKDEVDLEPWIRSPRRGTDHNVEKYFDNLISMIEDAAEGL